MKESVKRNSLLYIVFLVPAIVSSVYLLVLGYYALPVADDLGWARQVTEMNPFGFVKMMYFGWQGRYSALFVDGILCKYLGWNEHLLSFTIVELLLGYSAVILLLRNLIPIRDGVLLLIISITITNLGIMSFPELGTFFWLCTTNYVHEIWFSLYLIWFIFYCQRRWLQWVGVLLCSIYLGGCSENYAPVVVFVIGSFLLYRIIKDKEWRIWRTREKLLLFVSALIVFCGFWVMYFAPGNDVRLSAEQPVDAFMDHFSLSMFATKLTKATIVLFLRLLSRSWYFICAFPLFVFWGAQTERQLPLLSSKRVVLSFFIMLAVLVFSVAVMVYGLGWYATMRANCFMVFIVLAWVAYVGVLTGQGLKNKRQVLSVVLTSFAITVTSLSYIVIEYPIVCNYNHEVVAVHHKMRQYVEEGRKETVLIPSVRIPYRQSSYGYLRNTIQVLFHKSKRYYEEYFPLEPFVLDADAEDWKNLVYKSWLNSQFDIACIDETID